MNYNYSYNTMGQRFRHAVYLIKSRPKTSWLLVILGVIATAVIAFGLSGSYIKGVGSFSLLALPLSAGISAGVSLVCLKTVRLKDSEPKDLFVAFKDLKSAKRIIGGSLWTQLILSVWLVVPVIISAISSGELMSFSSSLFADYDRFSYGFNLGSAVYIIFAGIVAWVFLIIYAVKTIECAFVPFILLEREDVSPFDAWKESKKLTYGIRGRIFGFIFLPVFAAALIFVFLAALSEIRFIGGFFLVLVAVLLIFLFAYLPYFLGLGLAGFYEAAITAPQPVYTQYQQNPQYPQYPQQWAQDMQNTQNTQNAQEIYEVRQETSEDTAKDENDLQNNVNEDPKESVEGNIDGKNEG